MEAKACADCGAGAVERELEQEREQEGVSGSRSRSGRTREQEEREHEMSRRSTGSSKTRAGAEAGARTGSGGGSGAGTGKGRRSKSGAVAEREGFVYGKLTSTLDVDSTRVSTICLPIVPFSTFPASYTQLSTKYSSIEKIFKRCLNSQSLQIIYTELYSITYCTM